MDTELSFIIIGVICLSIVIYFGLVHKNTIEECQTSLSEYQNICGTNITEAEQACYVGNKIDEQVKLYSRGLDIPEKELAVECIVHPNNTSLNEICGKNITGG